MPSASVNLVSLPVELLEPITLYLEYAYEISSLSQTCRRLHSVANYHLFNSFAEDCSPVGIERVVKNNNVDALRKLLDNGLRFEEYWRVTSEPTPLYMTIEEDLAGVAELLVAYSEAFVNGSKAIIGTSGCFQPSMPGIQHYLTGLKKTLHRAALKGSLGVIKAVASCNTIKGERLDSAVFGAIREGHLALVRYFLEEHEEDNEEGPRASFKLSGYLRCAAGEGNMEILKYLVKAGADLNDLSFRRAANSPLVLAALENQGAVVHYLTEIGMRFPCLTVSDIFSLSHDLTKPKSKLTNVVQPGELRKIAADPQYDSLMSYNKGRFLEVVASFDDVPLYKELMGLSDDRDHLQSSFSIALSNGNFAFARYLVDEMRKEEIWNRSWFHLMFATLRDRSVPGFEILLDCGNPGPLDPEESWLNPVLRWARKCPELMEVLLQRGYLDKNKRNGSRAIKEILVGAFKAGDHAFVWRLMEYSELGLLDTLDDPELKYHDYTVLRLAASYGLLETFRKLLSTRNLALDPNNPIHCSALANTALKANIDVVGYFLEMGFDINALYPRSASRKNKAPEALIIQVPAVRPSCRDPSD
ncbi:uncharacterized protein KD926_005652 [Aspergillus affinis]|uniref:uncharacterized protein n=1 Tax=Aspergillus affinis TaxID=1070780 RepID=UPI0022FDC870|nr:uncharacterized protein KD926_005652 [Aspergillus affinis]KAI9042357.1 hypothetical protein KD926_005652 [Aspergillus affinis]